MFRFILVTALTVAASDAFAASLVTVKSRSGATAQVAPHAAAKLQCVIDGIEAAGGTIQFMGGWRAKGTIEQSKHPRGEALDINQYARNVVRPGLPKHTSLIAAKCGVLHGAVWRNADAGHFELTTTRNAQSIVNSYARAGIRTYSVAEWAASPALESPEIIAATPRNSGDFVAKIPWPRVLETDAAPQGAGVDPTDPANTVTREAWSDPLVRDRAYLVLTATPGFTMRLQGVENAIAALHPAFVQRAAAVIREARAAGLRNAGIYSSYRPPGLRIGGFRDKHQSLHAYGLASDFANVGRPGSKEAALWYRIALRHSLVNPYGYGHRREWNHYQVTYIRGVPRGSPLRATITAKGPKDRDKMWRVASATVLDRGAPRIRLARR